MELKVRYRVHKGLSLHRDVIQLNVVHTLTVWSLKFHFNAFSRRHSVSQMISVLVRFSVQNFVYVSRFHGL
jgi:hypothetical protein